MNQTSETEENKLNLIEIKSQHDIEKKFNQMDKKQQHYINASTYKKHNETTGLLNCVFGQALSGSTFFSSPHHEQTFDSSFCLTKL
jgi:hypothetical protein